MISGVISLKTCRELITFFFVFVQQQEGDKEKELCSYLKAYGVCRLDHLKLFILLHLIIESQEFV